ncbi:hypothetical protein BT96DRAFT_393873 [Gymnopus androsaceus JB14]|uniref:F-box domain-containing protein n=1 Tax=Gymnopus androsaceus JB14 TaxID=1447944 RepID=A0A6A4GUV2_9AGAR|nr:hypothetical protein BT96DRAFT_393873 [Gymnopus androsaceus JB14]
MFILLPAVAKREFSAFISRSSCNITKLSLQGISISHVDLISALRLILSLKELSISNSKVSEHYNPITPEFITSLHTSGQSELNIFRLPLVPKLCVLSLEFEGTAFDDAMFIDMISSRWLPDPEYATLHWCRLPAISSVKVPVANSGRDSLQTSTVLG